MRPLDHSPLTEEERLVLKRIEQALATTTSAKLLVSDEGEAIELPGALFQLLQQIVRYVGEGNMFFTIDGQKTLTTQEAADMLDVSRPYLIKLLEEGEIPFTKVGQHRRIRFYDLTNYQKRRKKERKQALKEMIRLSEELGLYDEIENPMINPE